MGYRTTDGYARGEGHSVQVPMRLVAGVRRLWPRGNWLAAAKAGSGLWTVYYRIIEKWRGKESHDWKRGYKYT